MEVVGEPQWRRQESGEIMAEGLVLTVNAGSSSVKFAVFTSAIRPKEF